MLQELIKLAVVALSDNGARSARMAGRISTTAIYAVGTGVAAVTVLGCLMATLWIYARSYVGAAGGALVVAAAIGVLWLALFFATRRPAPRCSAESPVPPENFLALAKEAQQLFQNNKGAVLLAALVAGLAAGNTRRGRDNGAP